MTRTLATPSSERAFGPSLLFGLALLAALVSSSVPSVVSWWAAAAFLILAALRVRGPLSFDPILAALGLYAGWSVLHSLVLSDVHRPEAIYLAAYLLVAGLMGAALGERQARGLMRTIGLIVGALALLGIVQHWTGWGIFAHAGLRASATFASPNSLATAINLALLPAIAWRVSGRGNRGHFLLVLLLFAGLHATQSRGGYLAFLAGVLVLAFALRRLRVSGLWPRARFLALALILCFLVLENLHSLVPRFDWGEAGGGIFSAASVTGRVAAVMAEDQAGVRFGLYDIAWRAIDARPLLGHGFLSFEPLYQAAGEDWLKGLTTHYVHSDYLQIWLETGLVGLLAFLTIGVLAGWRIVRGLPELRPDAQLRVCALAAALGSVCAHAAVDFPFHVPALVLLVGLGVGELCRITKETSGRRAGVGRASAWRSVGLIAVLVLSPPAVAEIVAQRGYAAIVAGDAKGAVSAYTLATRLAPYRADYHWAAGVILDRLARHTGDRDSADAADRFFAAGMAADPTYLRNALHRLRLHRDAPQLLSAPASGAVMLGWAERLTEARPRHEITQWERVLTLRALGRAREARRALVSAQLTIPDSARLSALAARLRPQDGSD